MPDNDVLAPGRRGRFLRRLVGSPAGAAGLGLVLAAVAVAFLAGHVAPGNPMALDQSALQPPSRAHPMGTDNLGREMFVAVVHGSRTTLIVVLWTAAMSGVIGLAVGALSGYRRGLTDSALMRLTEFFQSVPRFYLALLVAGLFGPGLRNLVVLLGLTSWPGLARVVRAETLSLRERDFVLAARSYGAGDGRIVRRHILPHVLPSATVVLALMASRVILIEAGLAFLGLGDPTRVSWGWLASNSQAFLQRAWWMSVFPGAAITLTVLGFNLLGDGIADALRPGSAAPLRRRRSPLALALPAPAADSGAPPAVLEVKGLQVTFRSGEGPLPAVRGIDLRVASGETVAIVGESGAGKSAAALALMGILPASATVSGSIRFRGTELVGQPEPVLRRLRGDRIALVSQDPISSLNPVLTVGAQIAEAIQIHRPERRRADVRRKVVELLDLVGIPNAAQRAGDYPHHFSGGMRQRVMIAMAIANDPDLLIADEPTTALDVTTQAQILELLRRLQDHTGLALLLITHDLGMVAGIADRVVVMYAGQAVEVGGVFDVFGRPQHPYTRALLGSVPTFETAGRRLTQIPGHPPVVTALPAGCGFVGRCLCAASQCADSPPPVRTVGGTLVRCHCVGEALGEG